MFCPRCNEKVTPVDGTCPGCGRVFRTHTVEKNQPLTEEERSNLAKMAQKEQDSPDLGWGAVDESEDLRSAPTIPVAWAKLKNAEKELRTLPRSKSSATPIRSGPNPLLVLAAAATIVLSIGVAALKMAGSPSSDPAAVATPSAAASAIPVSTPTLSKAAFLQAVDQAKPGREAETAGLCERGLAQLGSELSASEQQAVRGKLRVSQRLLAAQAVREAQAALAKKEWNQAFSLAESSIALNQAGQGPAQVDKQAKEILQAVQTKVAAKRPGPVESGPEPVAAPAVAEVPTLGEVPTVPTGHKVGRGGVPGAPAPQTISLPAPAKPTTVSLKPRPVINSAPAPKLGDQGVLPTYQTKSQYR